MEIILLFMVLPFALLTVVQYLICRHAKRRWVRFAPLALCLIPFVVAAVYLSGEDGPFVGLSGLVAFVYVIAGICALLGWGFAWGIYGVMSHRAMFAPERQRDEEESEEL